MRAGRSFEGRGGLVLIKSKRGWREGGKGGGGRTGGQFVRGSYKSFKRIHPTVLGKNKMKVHQFIIGGGVGRRLGGWGSSICAWKLHIILRG